METFEIGVTIIDAKGYYSGTEKSMIYFVMNRFQVGKMKTLVHEIDPRAYIAINDVADIYPANLETDRPEKINQKELQKDFQEIEQSAAEE